MEMKTALYQAHLEKGAKFINFAGWEMPLSYRGILDEHAAVRKSVGLFDVSHMGCIEVTGPKTLDFLEYLSTNTVKDKTIGKAFYTIFCNSLGGSLDDLLIFLFTPFHALLVVNACNRQNTLKHVQEQASRFDAIVCDQYDSMGILSLQGPKSRDLIKKAILEIPYLEPMQIWESKSEELLISRTGYTGEEGYELFAKQDVIVKLWARLLSCGDEFGLEPCGLGARDLLRLEMGYALYGNELSQEISPIESIAQWAVKLKAHNFLGKPALQKIQDHQKKRHPVALKGLKKALGRTGYPIYFSHQPIGIVTSGSFSPVLQSPIALGLIDQPLKPKEVVHIEIRKEYFPFQVVPLPFIQKGGHRKQLSPEGESFS